MKHLNWKDIATTLIFTCTLCLFFVNGFGVLMSRINKYTQFLEDAI